MGFIHLTKELLKNEHHLVLRELGRQIGVRAPSAVKNKDQLIQSILDVQNGIIPPVPESKRGAPPKVRPKLDKYLAKKEPEIDTRYGFEDTSDLRTVARDSAILVEGILEIHKDGYGFLRVKNYESSREDAHVSSQIIRKFNLRKGDLVKGVAIPKNEREAPAVQDVTHINGKETLMYQERPNFEDLGACHPRKKFNLSYACDDLSVRTLDLFAPIGMGQRGLIVAPPKTGKTTLIKEIARAIETNHPTTKVIVLLIDERPEEVTDISRSIMSEVVASTFDEGEEHHIRVAELVVNRAKRLVEIGRDVVILMDSITRLARAYNTVVESSGKTLSGGLDPYAMQGPKRLFGAGRNTERGGTLTMISTALIDTESRMDEVIFEEFKGTGNMEIVLSRELAEKRIFPAIDLQKSGTRKEDLLLSKEELTASYKIRKMLAGRKDATEVLYEMMSKTKNNKDLIERLDTWLDLLKK